MTVHTKSRFTRYLTIILRWLLVVSTVFILTFFSGAYITDHILPKVYTATAQTEIRPPNPDSIGSIPAPTPTIGDEVAALESPDVLLPVINDLGLDKTWAQRVFKSKEDHLSATEALAYMGRILKIDANRDTNTFAITAASDVPQEAADIANAVTDRYKIMRTIEEDQRLDHVENSLRDQITQEQVLVDEKKVEAGKILHELHLDAPSGAGAEATQEADLEARKKDLLAAQEDYNARRVLLEAVINLPDDQFNDTLQSLGQPQADIASLQAESAQRKSDVDKLVKAGATENDPRIIALRQDDGKKRRQLHELIAGLRRAMQVDTDMAKSRVALLQKEVDDLTAKLSQVLIPQLQPYREAQHQLQKQQGVLDTLNIRLKQVVTDRQTLESPVRILSRAEIPTEPAKPNKALDLVVTIVLASFLSIMAASFVEMIFLFVRASQRTDN